MGMFSPALSAPLTSDGTDLVQQLEHRGGKYDSGDETCTGRTTQHQDKAAALPQQSSLGQLCVTRLILLTPFLLLSAF